jgi:hypothetical protein
LALNGLALPAIFDGQKVACGAFCGIEGAGGIEDGQKAWFLPTKYR